MQPASQNPYPIYEQNLRFSFHVYDLTNNLMPYSNVAADTVALNIKFEFVCGLTHNDEKVGFSKKHTRQFKTREQKPYPIYDQNG